MNIKKYTIILCTLFIFQNTYSQDTIPKYDKVEFIDGKVLEGKFAISNIEGASGKDKIKIIWNKKENKSPERYPITEVKKITLLPNEGLIERYRQQAKRNKPTPFNATSEADLIRYYKVLYSPEKNIPRLVKFIYIGTKFEFYSFNKTHSSDKFQHHQIFITKPNSNIIEFHYPETNNKKILKKLNEYFKDCNEFTKESTLKNAHKKNISYYYKLANKCGM